MFGALIFNSVNSLEFSEVRRNLIRIPQVSQKIWQAQKIWDQYCESSWDIFSYLNSDDEYFCRHLPLKNLSTAIVQLGMLDRFLSHYDLPPYLLGVRNGDSAVHVASGLGSFEELIKRSQAVQALRPIDLSKKVLPYLTGISQAEFVVLKRVRGEFQSLVMREFDLKKTLRLLVSEVDTCEIMNIGPGTSHLEFQIQRLGLQNQLKIRDSIQDDSHLQWFYKASGTFALNVR